MVSKNIDEEGNALDVVCMDYQALDEISHKRQVGTIEIHGIIGSAMFAN